MACLYCWNNPFQLIFCHQTLLKLQKTSRVPFSPHLSRFKPWLKVETFPPSGNTKLAWYHLLPYSKALTLQITPLQHWNLLPQQNNSWLPCMEPTRSAQNRRLPSFLLLIQYLQSFPFHSETPLTIFEGINSMRRPLEFTGLLDWRFPPPLMWWPMKEKQFRTSIFMPSPSCVLLCAVCSLHAHFAVIWKLGNKWFDCL